MFAHLSFNNCEFNEKRYSYHDNMVSGQVEMFPAKSHWLQRLQWSARLDHALPKVL